MEVDGIGSPGEDEEEQGDWVMGMDGEWHWIAAIGQNKGAKGQGKNKGKAGGGKSSGGKG